MRAAVARSKARGQSQGGALSFRSADESEVEAGAEGGGAQGVERGYEPARGALVVVPGGAALQQELAIGGVGGFGELAQLALALQGDDVQADARDRAGGATPEEAPGQWRGARGRGGLGRFDDLRLGRCKDVALVSKRIDALLGVGGELQRVELLEVVVDQGEIAGF